VQRPTIEFVAPKTAEQLDLQALHRVRERLVSQRTGIINQIRAFLLIDDALAPDWRRSSPLPQTDRRPSDCGPL
jgi:transposase